jgi:hypothetical protein
MPIPIWTSAKPWYCASSAPASAISPLASASPAICMLRCAGSGARVADLRARDRHGERGLRAVPQSRPSGTPSGRRQPAALRELRPNGSNRPWRDGLASAALDTRRSPGPLAAYPAPLGALRDAHVRIFLRVFHHDFSAFEAF